MRHVWGALLLFFLFNGPLYAQPKDQSDSAKVEQLIQKANDQWVKSVDDAIATVKEAFEIAKRSGNPYLEARCWENLGVFEQDKWNYDRSVECLLNALRLWEKLNRQDKIAKAYSGIAGSYTYLGEVSTAEKYYKKCIETAERANVADQLTAGLMGMGTLADLKNEPRKAIGYYDKAMKIAQENNLRNVLNSLRINAGMSYKRMKDYPKALSLYKGAQTYFGELGDSLTFLQLYDNIGVVYTLMGKYEDAERAFLPAMSGLRKAGVPRLVQEIYADYSKMFEAKGDYAKALEWYRKKTELDDSLTNDAKNAQLAEVQEKYESEKKEQTIALQNVQIERQNLVRNLVIAVCLFVIAVAGILFWNYRKTQKLNRQLEDLNAIKNKLFSAISHDLRSPLMTLDATLAVLRRENVTQEELKQYTGHISHSMNSTLALLDNLLSWSLSQMSGLSLSPTQANVKELVLENIELYSAAADKKKITLSSEVPDGQMIYIDKNVGRLVIRNLINNAIKFTHENGMVSVSAEKKNGRVEISVKDNGLGMAAEHVKTLFELRTGKTTQGTAKEKGTGLGLVLCRELVEKSNGSISVQSELGKGTVFTVSVPANA